MKIKLKIVGFPQRTDIFEENTVHVENISEIIQHIESKYPPDYHTYTIFLNGMRVDDKSRNLRDGDEVVVVPTMSGG